MPYNTAAIPPSEEVTGSAILPLARVKKSINADEEIGNVSAQAAFLICKATEMFVQYLAERSHEMAKADPKPKRSLTYTHVSNAVARTDNLEFLSDVIPQTTTWRQYKAQSAAAATRRERRVAAPIDSKQTRIDGEAAGPFGVGNSRRQNSDGAEGSRPAPDPHSNELLLNGPPEGTNGKVNGEKKDKDGDVSMA